MEAPCSSLTGCPEGRRPFGRRRHTPDRNVVACDSCSAGRGLRAPGPGAMEAPALPLSGVQRAGGPLAAGGIPQTATSWRVTRAPQAGGCAPPGPGAMEAPRSSLTGCPEGRRPFGRRRHKPNHIVVALVHAPQAGGCAPPGPGAMKAPRASPYRVSRGPQVLWPPEAYPKPHRCGVGSCSAGRGLRAPGPGAMEAPALPLSGVQRAAGPLAAGGISQATTSWLGTRAPQAGGCAPPGPGAMKAPSLFPLPGVQRAGGPLAAGGINQTTPSRREMRERRRCYQGCQAPAVSEMTFSVCSMASTRPWRTRTLTRSKRQGRSHWSWSER